MFWVGGSAEEEAGSGPGAPTSWGWEGMQMPPFSSPCRGPGTCMAVREVSVIILMEEPRPSWDSPVLGDGDTSVHIASVPQRTERSEDEEMSEPEGPGARLLHCPSSEKREFEAGG